MGYTVVPDVPAAPTGGGFTVVPDAPAAAGQRSAQWQLPEHERGQPAWALGLSMMTGIDPGFFSNPEQGAAALKALARQGGLTGRYALEGLASITDPINAVAGLPRAAAVVGKGLDAAGLPKPEGATENFVGDVSRGLMPLFALGPAGATMKAFGQSGMTKAIGGALESNQGAQAASAATAAGAGSVGERQLELSPVQNLWFSLLAGGLGPAAASTAGAAASGTARTLKAAVQPLTEGGQGSAVARLLKSYTSNPDKALANLSDARELVPGSMPTTAEAAGDIGLAGLQRGLKNSPVGSDAFTARANAQNKARIDYLTQAAGTDADLKAAIANRGVQSEADYTRAYQAGGEINPQTNRMLNSVLDRPAIMQAWKQAETMAANVGMKPQDMDPNNLQFLHFMKKALDDIVSKAAASKSETGPNELRTLTQPKATGQPQGAKPAFLDVLDNISPLYGAARGNFELNSAPINRMTTLQGIMQRGQLATPNIDLDPVLSLASWKKAVAHPDVTGNFNGLLPEDFPMLGNVTKDLSRSSATASSGLPIRSDTAANLAQANVLNAALGKTASNNPLSKILMYPLNKIYSLGGVNENMAELLNRAMLDPQLAAKLIAAAKTPAARMALSKLFATRAPANAIGAAAGATGAESVGLGQ